MKTPFARDVLLKTKWDDGRLDDVILTLLSRGSPGNRSELTGSSIAHIGRSFLELRGGDMVPFHRVLSITIDDRQVWSRPLKEIDVEGHHMLDR